SQPTWVPVSPRSCRRQSDSSRRAGTLASRTTPLTVSDMSNRVSVPTPVLPFSSGAPSSMRRPFRGDAQGALGEHPGQVPPVLGRGVDVVLGLHPVPYGGRHRGPVRRGGR